MLNDPTLLEAANVLGEDIARDPDRDHAITNVFRKLTGRRPSEDELSLLEELFRKEFEKFREHPHKSEGWLQAGQYNPDNSLDQELIAAGAVVASTILNADASLTKREVMSHHHEDDFRIHAHGFDDLNKKLERQNFLLQTSIGLGSLALGYLLGAKMVSRA